MQNDWLGQPVTVGQPTTAAGIDAFQRGFLGYDARALEILAAADADPDSALANAYAAALNLFLEAPAGVGAAEPYLLRARAAAPAATDRERRFVRAIEAWAKNDMPGAIAVLESIAVDFPRDLAAVKLCQYHHFNLGDCPGMLRVVQGTLEAAPEVPYTHGLAAFAFEQCHLLKDAEASARRAIALQRKEPWAQHALAHVLLTQGRVDEGADFMAGMTDTWEGLNSFMYTHNWWHLALFRLSQGETDSLLELYDKHVWGIWKDYSQDQIGAVSLLLRLELAGIDVGDRWQDVADYLAKRVNDRVQPFLDLQYLYGLARAGRPETEALLTGIEDFAPRAPDFNRLAWTDVAVPAARALVAHARGDHATVLREMGLARPRMVEIGGSHAQRDLFEQVYLDSLIRSGHLVPAQQLLEQRRQGYPADAPSRRLLAQVYKGLGLPTMAARC